MRVRLSLRPSPDKGRTGGVCSGEIGFSPHDLPLQTPLIPPLSGGKQVDNRYRSYHAPFSAIPLEYKVIIKLICSNLMMTYYSYPAIIARAARRGNP
jgi:hypothetical protein